MKKILSLLVCFAMLFTFVTVLPASAETTLTTAVGEDGKTYHLIYTPDDYLTFVTAANADLSINGKLMADLDMSAVTKTAIHIGNYGKDKVNDGVPANKPYTGTFDGNYHVIRNITVKKNLSSDSNAGVAMFNMTDGATIKNLGVENAEIWNSRTSGDGRSYYGGVLVAYAKGATTIENCYVKNSRISRYQKTEKEQWTYAGFIAGQFSGSAGVVNNCYSINNTYYFEGDTITAYGNACAGFIGATGSATVTNSYAKGTTFSKSKAYSFARKTTAFESCYTDTNKFVSDGYTCGANVITDANVWATLADTLGSAWKNDTYNLNGGAPRLAWEVDPAVYDVTIDAAIANGTVSADKATAVEGAQVTLTVTPASGYMIGEVKVNGEAIEAPYTFTMPAGAVTVTATFVEEQKYNVTIDSAIAGGTVTASVEKAVPGTEVTITATPESDIYKLEGITVNGEALASPYTFTLEADTTVSATFTKRWEKGTGTETDPILIETIADLNVLRTAVNGEKHFAGIYFRLENDLNFDGNTGFESTSNSNFATIGVINSVANSNVRYFSGNFDGNNKTIKNLIINTSARYVSLFGIVKNATIKNLGIEDSTFRQQGSYYAAGIATQATDSTIENCYVKNSTMNVKSATANNPMGAGGIVAIAGGTTTITNSYAKDITLRTETDDVYFSGAAGGIAGQLSGTAKIENCYAANLTYTKAGSNLASIARVYNSATIVNSYADEKKGKDSDSIIVLTDVELRAASLLGNGFKTDFYAANGGFPMLAWENTAGLEKDIDFVYAGLVKDGDAISAIKLEKADATALAGKLYAAVFSGDVMNYAKLANVSENSAGVKTITLPEAITLAEGEELRIFVWDNNLNPLMYAVK